MEASFATAFRRLTRRSESPLRVDSVTIGLAASGRHAARNRPQFTTAFGQIAISSASCLDMRHRAAFISICVVLSLAASFWGGMYWERYSLLTSGPLVLKHDVAASVGSDGQGSIPKGAVFYPFMSMGETSQYIVFVEMKERDILTAAPDEGRATVSPLHAYPKPDQ